MTREKMKTSSTLAVFASYYKPHMRLFLFDMVCALLIAVVDLLFPWLSRHSLQNLLPENRFSAFYAVIAIMVGAYLLHALLNYIVTYWGHTLGVRIEADIRRDLFSHMQNLSFRFYDKNRTGYLISRITGDLFEVTELAHHGPEDLFISFVTLIGAFVIMLTIRWELALAVFIIVPIFLVFTMILRKRLNRVSLGVKQKLAVINGEVETSISGMRTAKAFANEATEHAKFTKANHQFRDSKRNYFSAMGTYHSVMTFSMNIMPVLVIGLGGWLIMGDQMNYVDLLTFTLYVNAFITPMRKLSMFVEQYTQGMAGFKRFLELMRTDPDIVDTEDAVTLNGVTGDIQVDDLTFRYDADGEDVLSHVSLHVQPGETVAVVGPSGGGKTTLCQLIPRFYDVTEGSIKVDGHDVRAVTQKSLRENIGIVQQDVFLFAGTVYDNILYGRPTATEAEIIDAAKKAEIYDDIMAMPNGFHTEVGERGVMLSGGQKQRISIARIFLKNPPVLILDEATSALDSVTEHRIQSAFDELAKGRTTLIIAHRLSTIRNASRVIVIDDNCIVEEGTHEQLLAKGGEYADLWKAQQAVQSI